jgi:hypothetical protein
MFSVIFFTADFLQVLIPVAEVSFEPAGVHRRGNNVRVVSIDFGAKHLATSADFFKSIGLASLDFFLGLS